MNIERMMVLLLLLLLQYMPSLQSAESFGTAGQDSKSAQPQAQTQTSESTAATRPLSVFILEGNGAVNNVRSRAATPIIIEVRDERSLPVDGAEVALQLPPAGPSGFFPGQQLTWTGRTDANGQSVVSVTPNQEAGRFSIQVIARYGPRLGRSVISQTNSMKAVTAETSAQHKHSSWWKIAAVAAAAGAAGGIVWATHGSGSSQTTVGLQPGPVAIGAPR